MEKLDKISMRMLACLVEKQKTTPEQYPLTLNSLVNACNQKSSRSPVMSLTQADVGQRINDLEQNKWLLREFGARTERYEHKLAQKLSLNNQQLAVLTALM